MNQDAERVRLEEMAKRTFDSIKEVRGKHNMKHKSNEKTLKVRGLLMVKQEDKQKVIWKIGRIVELFVGKDGIIGGVRIKTAKGFLNNQSNCISHWNLTETLSLMIVTRLNWE